LALFDELDHVLADGRRYLCGDALSAADLSFAALAAPLLLPAAYPVRLPPLHALPAAAQADLDGWASRPAGAYGLRIWSERRRPAA
jgi:glutathione S-transferase